MTSHYLLAASDTPALHAPSIAYHALAPILIVLITACVGVLVEAVIPRKDRFNLQLGVSLLGLLAALVTVALLHNVELSTVAGAISVDGAGLFIQGSILILAFLSFLLMAERGVDTGSAIVAQAALVVGSQRDRELNRTERVQTEIFPLGLFAVAGMLIFPLANNLLLMFIALEVLSLPLYLMAGMARRRRLLSQEAALKYFLLGAFASAFFLYGLALLYGYANSVDLSAILAASQGSGKSDVLLYMGMGLLLVGLLFKAGVAPFHNWTPDVYQGSPTPVTAFMASCTKIAAFGAILRVLYVGVISTTWEWRPVIWAVAITSMLVGAVFGLTQTDVKRILAYSSIAHAGFLLVGLTATSTDAISGTLFYLVTYGLATVAAFGLTTLVRDADGEAAHLSQWSGLARKSPLFAVTMTILLMSMAGIPLTAGFIGKFVIFKAAWHDAGPLVVIALICSAIAAFYYLRIVVMMFFAEPPENAPTVAIPSSATAIAVSFSAAATVVLGIIPQPLLDLAARSAFLYK
ncbi:NADH-quinone oxidoreductase subunit N [Frankineae bacterium MT45]|nr:NADH-quinone oxidoreductase subunit N [Frankineae bacterium MT45]